MLITEIDGVQSDVDVATDLATSDNPDKGQGQEQIENAVKICHNHHGMPTSVMMANSFNSACWRLTLPELQIVLAAIATAPGRITADTMYFVHATDIADALDLDRSNIYESLKSAHTTLWNRRVRIPMSKPDGKPDGGYVEVRWIQGRYYNDGGGTLGLQFSDALIPYLSELKQQFTKLLFSDLAGLGMYAMRLYMLACQYRSAGKMYQDIDHLREIFDAKDKLKTVSNFKRLAIDQAITQINLSAHTAFNLEATPVKKKGARGFVGFDIKLLPKDSLDPELLDYNLTEKQRSMIADKLLGFNKNAASILSRVHEGFNERTFVRWLQNKKFKDLPSFQCSLSETKDKIKDIVLKRKDILIAMRKEWLMPISFYFKNKGDGKFAN